MTPSLTAPTPRNISHSAPPAPALIEPRPQMRKITALVFILLALVAIGYRATHHPVYGHCYYTAGDKVCTLLAWKGNK